MKHAIDESTRAIVRNAITAIRSKFNLSRAEAESYFRRNLGISEVHMSLIEAVADDIREQKEEERLLKESKKDISKSP
jgi:uncharacterized protein YlxP (DUF503 family)